MSDEKFVGMINDARLISAVDHIIYPLLKKLSEYRLTQALGKSLNGETDFVGDIAYIQAIKDIENQLKKMTSIGNKANLDLNKENI